MIKIKYSCGTCGLEIIDVESIDTKNLNCIVEKKIWHECVDGYVVTLQPEVSKYKPTPVEKPKDEPTHKKSHK